MSPVTGVGGEERIYKVVEVADVVDRTLEEALNRWTGEGYRFESVHFVTQPGSRRPSLAFLLFTRGGLAGGRAGVE